MRPSWLPLRFIRFCLVGGSGVVVNLLVFRAAKWLLAPLVTAPDMRFAVALALGILTSILTNFLLNDRWTWADGAVRRLTFRQRLCAFYGVSLVGGGVQFVVAAAARAVLPIADEFAVLIGIAAATAVNFLVNDRFTFQRSED